MQGNRSTDTKPEKDLRRALWREGLRGYRKNRRDLPGKPDITFGKARVCIFIHGCFWHGCDKCARPLVPKTNTQFWIDKVARNKARDDANVQVLGSLGYRVIVVWECELRNDIDSQVKRVRRTILDGLAST